MHFFLSPYLCVCPLTVEFFCTNPKLCARTLYVKVRIYICMHAYANCFTFLLWGVRHASVRCFDVYFCVLHGWSQRSIQHHGLYLHHPVSRWSQVWYGKTNSCRAGGSGRTIFEIPSCQGGEGGGAKQILLLAPPPWQTKRSLLIVTLCRSK